MFQIVQRLLKLLFCFFFSGFLFPFGYCKTLLSMSVTGTSSHLYESSSQPQSLLFSGKQDETTATIQQLLKFLKICVICCPLRNLVEIDIPLNQFSLDLLRILTGKKHPKIKLQRLLKIRIWTFESLVYQTNTF